MDSEENSLCGVERLIDYYKRKNRVDPAHKNALYLSDGLTLIFCS